MQWISTTKKKSGIVHVPITFEKRVSGANASNRAGRPKVGCRSHLEDQIHVRLQKSYLKKMMDVLKPWDLTAENGMFR